VADRLRADGIRAPLPVRLPRDPVLAAAVLVAHDDALARGAETYRDPRSGLLVLTAATLAARERCCGSGCRHCPYEP